ncbi:dihydroorotase family protein [Marinovum sp. 2_MG-2023]|uniref:dihydroorotase n=1 Tax=unclassified Marinovum TaxID=2647166 RepID=UPI0026E35D79|nr:MULTISPECIES: dihydroorotase family protein [unclassified Marinovum]MDO6732622.1 dihydroorotase family protein [Marinovum sp. 2_MG-2023]MDO6781921.1 dihydroorotase family protein [Marinovum sp. 1_MG-2023]
MDLLLRGTIVTPDAVLENGWVAVKDGHIAALGQGAEAPDAQAVRDFGTGFILPGVIDGQTHATSCKGMEGIADTTRGALAGGVTTLVDMPYDNPLPLDRIDRFAEKTAAIATQAHADMALYGTATRETGTANMAALIAAGVCAFKISSFESSPSRFPRIGADLMLDMMEVLAPTDLPLGLHNEDQEIVLTRMAAARAEGRDGIEAHAEARPMAAELVATAQLLALAQATGAHAHPVHLTGGEGFAQVAAFAGMGVRATGETCVHYLWFDASADGAALGARMKVNPPIRAGRIEGLWQAMAEGQVAFVSSDHSSWPIDNKLTASIFDAGAGVPGLQTLLPAFYTLATARGADAIRLTADQLSHRPARFFGLGQKGGIEVGKDADFAVLQPGEVTFDEADALDGLRWSPFHGTTFAARVTATFLRGAEVWDGQNILNTPGSGRFVPRSSGSWFHAQGIQECLC